jgi:uncharacterized protein with FMN-binding domain
MKRAFLIAGGTVGGLGAVLAITPPQMGASDLNIASGASMGITGTGISTPASSSSPANTSATATKSSKPVATKKATAAASAASTQSADATPVATQQATAAATASTSASATPTAVKTTATPTATPTATKTTTAAAAPAAKSGTFTGPSVYVNYGNVQVQITVVNGVITDAQAIKAPSGRNDRYTNMAVPILKKQTLAAQSANIKGASGASYTSYGWFKSLQGALADAGL